MDHPEPLQGMVIGAVDGILITDDTPIDYDQWEDGKPWHVRKDSLLPLIIIMRNPLGE